LITFSALIDVADVCGNRLQNLKMTLLLLRVDTAGV